MCGAGWGGFGLGILVGDGQSPAARGEVRLALPQQDSAGLPALAGFGAGLATALLALLAARLVKAFSPPQHRR